MIVKCIDNRIEKVCTEKTSKSVLKVYGRLEGEAQDLQRGRLYTVYAMFVADEVKWYLLRYREDAWYPRWYSECFFEIVDETPSRYWAQTREDSVATASTGVGILYAFFEFTEIENFYCNLIDRCDKEVNIFKRIARKIKDEAIY